jgi:hypothetical protein
MLLHRDLNVDKEFTCQPKKQQDINLTEQTLPLNGSEPFESVVIRLKMVFSVSLTLALLNVSFKSS